MHFSNKGLVSIIVYFEDIVKGFPKRISFYFMISWFERYPKLKLTNFGNFPK
jgi:hypothetical protein